MMTSINPKNVNLNNNMRSNEGDITPSTANSLFQRNNFGIEKDGMDDVSGNNMKFKTNSNINYNMNDKNYNPSQGNSFKNLANQDMNADNNYLKLNNNNLTNNANNLNYNTQNNSINLNLGLQAKKNYSTPILNEGGEMAMKQQMNYNKQMDMFDRNQPNKNMMNYGQNQGAGNDYYLAEIEKLKSEINNLKKNNDYLSSQLKEEQRKNEQLFSIQKAKEEGENSILSEISHCLQVSSFEEILPKLNEIINYLNNNVNSNMNKNNNQDSENKIRDELISKLQNLYLSLTGSDEKKEEITIKILWRWIKHLINTVKQLALEKEKNIEIYQNIQEIDDCKEYCEELISEFNLQSLDELKMFIDNLLKQSNLNIMKGNEEQQQQQLRNAQMGGRQMPQQQFQVQNYHQDEENEEVEAEGEGEPEAEVEDEGEGEGEEEGDENEIDNNDPNQQQYEAENEYDENNEMMQQQMEINNQGNPNEENYNFKYDANVNQGNQY